MQFFKMFYKVLFLSISWYTAAIFVNSFLFVPSSGQAGNYIIIYFVLNLSEMFLDSASIFLNTTFLVRATIDKGSGSSILIKKPELAKNPNQHFENLSPSKIASSQYEDEYVDMNSEVLSNGDVNLKFSSHGKEHSLKLTKRKRLGDIKVNLIGSSDRFKEAVSKRIQVMRFCKVHC